MSRLNALHPREIPCSLIYSCTIQNSCFPSTLSPLPKANRGHCHPHQSGWFSSLAHSPGCSGGLVCTITGQPVMQHKPQEPTQCLPCPSPSLLLATTHAIHPSISHPQPREEPVSRLMTTKGTYTSVTGAAHKARATARMCPILREKPAADMHTLQIAANSSDNCIP